MGIIPPHNECPGHDIKPSDDEAPVLELSECGVPLHYDRSQAHSDPEWLQLIRVLSMGQIELIDI